MAKFKWPRNRALSSMHTTDTRRPITPKIAMVIFLVCIAVSISAPPLFAWSVKILDKETGRPLEEAVVVRSWDRMLATPGGAVSSLVTFEEALSDKDGKFNISIFKRMLHISVPLLAPIRENNPIVFKPGYKFLVVSNKSATIELERIPATYYVRYEEAEKARGNYEIDFHETKLFKKVVEEEEKFINRLNKYVPGVWYTGFIAPHDIAVDQRNTVFVADGYGRSIIKLSPEGKQHTISRSGSGGSIDIEFDQSGNLYSFRGGSLYYDNNRISMKDLPTGDIRFALGQNKRIFLVSAYKPFLLSYDLEGNLLCRQKVPNRNSTEFEGNIQLIDIDSGLNGSIIVACSYFNPYWDKSRKRYATRNGIVIFDQNCNETLYKEIDIDRKVRSITATESGFVVADTNSIYVYDKDINLIFKEKMKGKELGIVDIQRISCDESGTYLYIVESRYERILKFNLKTREFCIR